MPFIEIDKQKFFNNLDIIAQKTKSKDKIAIVLKDNAYGHGLEVMAQLSQAYGLTKAVVQTHDEAQKIKHYFDYILVLADIPKQPIASVCYTINDLDSIKHFPQGTRVELKVDSGMHRNGIDPRDLHKAFKAIQQQKLKLEAIFTHHRSADELTSEWFWQNENFKKIKSTAQKLAQQYNLKPLRFHKDNSASLLRTNNFDEDMARIGIAAYGCIELPTPLASHPLNPILTLKAFKITTKKLPKGSRIGYGGAGKLQKDLHVSTYDIGYGDGFFRSLSHTYKTPDGISIVGRISMDNSSFASDKDLLTIFNDAREIAKQANTISYEILTSLKQNIIKKII